jgi:uncharacterized repeat protein (TIGR01451 family)
MGFVISMKFFSKFRTLAILAVALMAIGTRAEAQGFGISVTLSTNVIAVGNSLTYTINMTNLTLGGSSSLVSVTNTFPATAQLLGASITPGPAITVTNANGFSFNNFPLNSPPASPSIQTITVMAEPTQGGLFTNTVVVAIFNATNITVSLVAQVTTNTAGLPQANLAVAMTGPASAVFTNDWMVYGVNVTNLGPATATGVFLTNTLPTNVVFQSVSPASPAPTVQGTNVIFNLGTLTNGAFRNFQLTVQPTNAGTLTFSSVVSTNGVFDPIPANNSASTNITVLNYFPASLVVYTNSTQIINFLNALTEQSITVSNAGASSVAAVRVVVTGLTNQLFNAVGTNNGSPFVVYGSALNTNQTVKLLLQYYPRSIFPFTNGQLHAFAVVVPNLTPPPMTATSTNVITHILKRSDGSMLLIWPSTQGRTYTVVYSDNVLFSNALIAPPSIVAPANQTPWIDYGPPTTVSAPPNSSNRFYRVFLNP